MKSQILILLLAIGIYSCSVQQPRVPMMSHEDVMSEDYPTKKSVFIKFGSPTKTSTFENIENWYYKLSEVTNSQSVGFSTGTGKIGQNPSNPFVAAVNRSLIIQQNQLSSVNTRSTILETYVTFWISNDSVIKWESRGVDYSRPLSAQQIEELNRQIEELNKPVSIPKAPYANELLFDDKESSTYFFAHNSITREVSSGINGPLTYSGITALLEKHEDFKNAFLPSLKELRKVFESESKLRFMLLRNSMIVWSSDIDIDGNIQCLNFRTGEVINKNPESLNYFVPLVKLKNNS